MKPLILTVLLSAVAMLIVPEASHAQGANGIIYGDDNPANVGQFTFDRPANRFRFSVGDRTIAFINYNGISVGTGGVALPAGYLFAVDGRAIMEEVTVDLSQDWPDYVFNKEYNLVPLEDLEAYIAENGHLPAVPSATEVEENGVDLGVMNAVLLQKVEELTLYVIQANKENQALRERIEALENAQ